MYDTEKEEFKQNPANVVDATPDGDTVKEGFNDRLTPALTEVYQDMNLLKAAGMIGVGVPATDTARGIGRSATAEEVSSGKTGGNGPAWVTPERLESKVAVVIAKATAIGMISFLPFRFNQLPTGWYFINGIRYNNDTAQANAINALSAEFKSDWGITNNGATTNVPNWFYGGRGPTMRGVDGSSRQVGSVEDGAIQNVTGAFASRGPNWIGFNYISGAFYGDSPLVMRSGGNDNVTMSGNVYLNISRQVATANEVRMLNRGMTPAIFLGV